MEQILDERPDEISQEKAYQPFNHGIRSDRREVLRGIWESRIHKKGGKRPGELNH